MMIPFWFILKVCGMFRVPAAVEEAGLDHSYHGGSAYPGGPEEMTDKSLRAGNGAGAGAGYNGGSNVRAYIESCQGDNCFHTLLG